MGPSRRSLWSFVLAPVLTIALAATALGTDHTYAIRGFEIAATTNLGTFVGVGKSTYDND